MECENNLVCPLCKNTFYSKSNFDKHSNQCIIFMMFKSTDPSKPKSPSTDGESQQEEPQPPVKINKTTQIQYIIKILERQSKEIQNLKTELSKVKTRVYMQKKKKAKFALEMMPCSYDFKTWIDGIEVNQDTISIVFEYDLKMGIRYILSCEMKKTDGKCPFVSFKEKENTVYYYNGEKWNIMKSNEYFYLVNRLSSQIYNYYTEWKAKQTFTKTEEKEHVKHYFKICGDGSTEEATISYVKKWMYNKVKIEGHIDEL